MHKQLLQTEGGETRDKNHSPAEREVEYEAFRAEISSAAPYELEVLVPFPASSLMGRKK